MFRYLATCPKGLASLLKPELEGLGASDARETVAGVSFSGPLAVAYRACLHSRFANRLLLQISEFAVGNADDLYEGVLHLPWHEHLRPDGTLAVDFAGHSTEIRNTQFGARRCKDAIVDGFRSRGQNRPSVDLKQPDLRINARMHRGKVTISIDLSGQSLHRRGYRTNPGKAPLKENLAAAVLARAGWPAMTDEGMPFIDPMCGSGTLLIEAAMMALNHAPGLGRRHHGFDAWLGHQADQWSAIVADARAQQRQAPPGLEIRGYDGDIQAIRRAQATVGELGLEDLVRVRPKGLEALTRPSHRSLPRGLLVCNPPWGERMGDGPALERLYRQLGETLHAQFQGWRAGVLTSRRELGRAVGLRSHRQYAFNNGALDVQLLLFELNADNHLSPGPGATAAVVAPGEPIDALSAGAQMVLNRLQKNSRKLRPWIERTGTSCYRLYDADMPEYAVALDVYEGRLHIAEYAPPKTVDEGAATRRLNEVIAATCAMFSVPEDAVAVKRRQRQKGSAQYTRVSDRGERFAVREGKAKLLVNLHDYLDTGLFLDHRPLRLRIGEEAKGCHFLNLFCYTGAATVHAALGGAATSTSVDLSNTYLSWFQENLALNGLSERQHRAERADCLAWLAHCDRQFDLVLLDPPSFSNSKSTDTSFDVQRDHLALIDAAMRVLAPEGTLYFSNNRKGFVLDSTISEGYAVEDMTRQTLPEDFARRPDIHGCWRLRHR